MTLQANVPQKTLPQPWAQSPKPKPPSEKTPWNIECRNDDRRKQNRRPIRTNTLDAGGETKGRKHSEKVSDLAGGFWESAPWMSIP